MAIDGEGAFHFELIGVDNTVKSLPFEVGVRKAVRATLTLETAQIRFRYDGADPGAGVGGGHVMEIGEKVILEGHQNIKNFKAIRTGSTSGNLSVTLESQ